MSRQMMIIIGVVALFLMVPDMVLVWITNGGEGLGDLVAACLAVILFMVIFQYMLKKGYGGRLMKQRLRFDRISMAHTGKSFYIGNG